MLDDVQNSRDERDCPIDHVGVRGIRYPIHIKSASGEQHSIANLTMGVQLAAHLKGTHMSRFLEVLEAFEQPWDYDACAQFMHTMLLRLEAKGGDLSLSFPFFRTKTAPVSKVKSLMDYQVEWLISQPLQGPLLRQLKVVVPVTSLCPCSKKISDYGAHNQRSHVTLTVEQTDPSLTIERLLDIAEDAASCSLYGILKRQDEKYVTEYAYDHPKFVEDMARDLALALSSEPGVGRFCVESENFESIHNHSAYARIERNS